MVLEWSNKHPKNQWKVGVQLYTKITEISVETKKLVSNYKRLLISVITVKILKVNIRKAMVFSMTFFFVNQKRCFFLLKSR